MFFFSFQKLLNEWFWIDVHHNSNFQTFGRLFGFNSFIYSAWIWCAPNNNNASTIYSLISNKKKKHIRLDAYMTKHLTWLLTRYRDSNFLWFVLNQCRYTFCLYVLSQIGCMANKNLRNLLLFKLEVWQIFVLSFVVLSV